jgi:hypothetical protein
MSEVRFRERWSIERGKYGAAFVQLRITGIHEAVDPIIAAVRGSLNAVLQACHYDRLFDLKTHKHVGEGEPPPIPQAMVFLDIDTWRTILEGLLNHAPRESGDHGEAARLLADHFNFRCQCGHCDWSKYDEPEPEKKEEETDEDDHAD